MAELIARSACEGLLPLTVGDIALTEVTPVALTSLAAYKGQDKALSAALKAAHGVTLPGPNRATGTAEGRVIWLGRGQVMLVGPTPDATLLDHATVTDQSDGWAVVRLDGALGDQVLARLVPIDVRTQVFKRGHTARTDLRHMMASLTRVGDKAFQIMVFRSMAQTLVHDMKSAMEAVTAAR